MCAICGIKLKNASISMAEAVRFCEKMADSMKHRGPDDHGTFVDESHRVVLGHRRLSIIDLSTAGRQPLFNEDRSLAILLNGEIYNHQELRSQLQGRGHRFVSHSDTEVVVHLFEEKKADAWKSLRGMYAAAIYDTRSGEIHLARDPLGIKPLYVFENRDLIAFSSEIQAFHVFEDSFGELDGNGIADFLMWGSTSAPKTLWKSVKALVPGEMIRISSEGFSSTGGSPIPQWCQHASEARPSVMEMKECLRDSVRKHLISDAPIGLFLSGGIDSGTLAGISSEISTDRVHTVSITIPGHELDESVFARQTAEAYQTHHTEIPLDRQEFEKDLALFFTHLDLPSIDGFNTFIVSRAARRAGLTVALSGVGGDELFGGYPSFHWMPRFYRAHRMAHWGGSLGTQAMTWMLQLFRSDSGAARATEVIRSQPADLRAAYLACRGLFVGRFLNDLLLPEFQSYAGVAHDRYMEETAWTSQPNLSSSVVVGGLELTRYMTHQLLRDTDVMSMASSLEVRTPLVDVEVIRKGLSFLTSPHIGDGHPKWVLRQSLEKPLPQSVVTRHKQGFVFPWQEWLQGMVLKDFDQRLKEPQGWNRVLNPKSVRWWREAYVKGWAHWSCFWAIYVLMRFLDRRKN